MAYFIHQSQQLYYSTQGEGDLVIILPGNTASSNHTTGELDFFSQKNRAVALDLRGTGRSARMACWPLSWWELAAADAVALTRHLGYERVVLFGFSGGGVAALLAAALYPDQVRAVIADSCVEWIDFQSAVRGRTRNPLEILRQEKNLPAALKRIQGIPAMAAFWRQGHGSDWKQVVEADTALLQGWQAAGGDVFTGRLEQVRCPVLLTASLEDHALPNVALQIEAMRQKISRCQVSLSDHGEHPLCWSQPEFFRKVADAFLQNLP